jgi:hypothetical protein
MEKTMPKIIETLLVTALSILVTQYGDKIVEILRAVADRLNDKIEGTQTQLDDITKETLVTGLEAMIVELKVDAVDGAPGEPASA